MKILGSLAALAVLAIALVWAFDPSLREMREDRAAYARERQRIALERERFRLEQEQARAPLDLAGTVIVWGCVLGILGCVTFLAVQHHQRRARLVWPNERGHLPVPREGLESGQLNEISAHLLTLTKAVEALAAARPAVPAHYAPSLTYSPEWEHHSRDPWRDPRFAYPGESAPEEGGGQGGGPRPPGAPPFGELFARGLLGPGLPLIFGYDESGAAITGTLDTLYSCGIGGGQGSGKTSIALYLGAQTALQGGELVVVDPHGDSPRGLGQRIAPLAPAISGPVAVDPRDILDRLRYVWRIFKDRERRGAEDEHPVLLLIDEWTALLRRELAERLPAYLADLAIDGRKFRVYAALCAHRWSVEATGGADVRNMLTSHYVARNRPEEVRMQTGFKVSTLPADPLLLAPGQSIFVPNAGSPSALYLPFISDGDIARVGASLGARPHTRARPAAPTPPPGGRGGQEGAEAQAEAGTGDEGAEPGTVRGTPGDTPAARPSAPWHYAEGRAGTRDSGAVQGAVRERYEDTGVPARGGDDPGPEEAEADESEEGQGGALDGRLTPEAIRALHRGGWSRTQIAGLLRGTKQKRLSAVESALSREAAA